MARIYVASSWRNLSQPMVVELLRRAGHQVYDFRNPPASTGFSWSEIDPEWQSWTAEQYIRALSNRRAVEGFRSDFEAMQWADACVLVLPSGRSAHLELGWCAGAGKRTAILTGDGEEPELMAKMADLVTASLDDVVAWLRRAEASAERPWVEFRATSDGPWQIVHFSTAAVAERWAHEGLGDWLADVGHIHDPAVCLVEHETRPVSAAGAAG